MTPGKRTQSSFIQDSKPRPVSRAWFEYEVDKIPMALYQYALGMEMYSYGRRVKNSVMYRLVTGEDPPITLGMWMSRKVATAASGFGSNYTKPYSNIIANSCSVLENRIGTIVPFIQVQPNDVSFEVRTACRDLMHGVDAIFDANGFAQQCRIGFRDKFTWGMRVTKVGHTDDEKEVTVKRTLIDNLIVDEVSCAAGMPPSNIVERVFIPRSDAFAMWGGQGGEDGIKIDSAIRAAPSAFMGNTLSNVQVDFIAALEGYSLPDVNEKNGWHVLCLNGVHLQPPKPWKRKRLPYAIDRWQPQIMGFFSPGGAFVASPYQMQVNNLTEQINAAIRAFAYPRWLAAKGSTVTAQTLGARPGAVHYYTGQAPTPIVPQAVNAELYEERDRWENKGYAANGITAQQVQGQKQPGVNAGVALRMMVNIEDSRNKALLLDAEQHVEDVAELVIDECEEINPTIATMEVPSRKMPWKEIKLARDARKIIAFPISSLPATPEGKAQQIADWYANGDIDERAYFRLQQLPDLTTFARLKTASDDLIESILDEIVKTQKFIAPEPTFDAIEVAVKAAQARYNLERRYKSPRPVLRALRQFIAVAVDMVNHPEGRMLPPEQTVTAPSALPAGTLPAAPPLQVVPSQGAPAVVPPMATASPMPIPVAA